MKIYGSPDDLDNLILVDGNWVVNGNWEVIKHKDGTVSCKCDNGKGHRYPYLMESPPYNGDYNATLEAAKRKWLRDHKNEL